MFRGVKIERLMLIIFLIMAGIIFFFDKILPELLLDGMAYVAFVGSVFLLIKFIIDLVKDYKKRKVNKRKISNRIIRCS